jgi:REP-associated tyrosine transposase
VVQADDHLWAVLRYIEANPLRAGMVNDPATYRWSSYPAHGEGRADPLLTPLPEWPDLGPDEPARRLAWRRKVMADQPAAEVESIRRSLRGGLPFGGTTWVEEMATKLGTQLERRPPGRPRK